MEVSNIEASVPEFGRMQTVQDQIFRLIETWNVKALPRVGEQLEELSSLLLGVERSFKESLIGGIVLLEDREFVPGAEGADTHHRLASVLTRLGQLHQSLARQNQRLELFPLSALAEALPELEARVVKHQQQASTFDARLTRLRQQRAYVAEAIEVFGRPSVASAFKGLIPSDDDIDQIIGLITDPKVDAGGLKALTQKLRKHADVLEGAKTFSDLSKARSRLDEKIEDALADQRHIQQLVQSSQDQLNAVQALCGVEPLKVEWLREIRKVELQWQAQAGKLDPTMNLSVASAALQALCEYLKGVQLAYDRI